MWLHGHPRRSAWLKQPTRYLPSKNMYTRPFAPPSVKCRLASSIGRLPGQHQPLYAPTHTLKCRHTRAIQKQPQNTLLSTHQPPTSHHPTTNQCRAKSNGGISPNRPRSGACKYRRRLSIFKKALANESESPDPAEGGTPWPNRRGLPWHTGSSKYMNGNQPRVPEGRCRGKRYQDQTAHHSTARSMSFSLGTPRPNHAPGIERSI